MINNTRRNRNIGTSKQGYGQNNRMKIPSIWYKNDTLHFTEHLNNYRKEVHFVNDHEFIFIIEETLTDYKHACSVQDIVYLLQFVTKDDYDDLRFIVFRQPKLYIIIEKGSSFYLKSIPFRKDFQRT